jgi:hypothetical protein
MLRMITFTSVCNICQSEYPSPRREKRARPWKSKGAPNCAASARIGRSEPSPAPFCITHHKSHATWLREPRNCRG